MLVFLITHILRAIDMYLMDSSIPLQLVESKAYPDMQYFEMMNDLYDLLPILYLSIDGIIPVILIDTTMNKHT